MHKRKLNELEYLNWLIGQPYNISMAITIEGTFPEDLLRNSLKKLQIKHPILQAQLDVNDNGEPYFFWEEIDQIPLEIIPRTQNDNYKRIVAKEFITPFKTGIDCYYPLIRVKLLKDKTVSDLIVTLQHVIGDGMSMVFLFRDIIDFMANPDKNVTPLEPVKNLEDVLPLYFQKKIPKTPRRFKVILWFVQRILGLRRFKQRLRKAQMKKKSMVFNNFKDREFVTRAWKLDEVQSQLLIKKCRENEVTVHSAICTIFLQDFPIINNPVNLREKLAYQVGESVGLYAGGLVIKKKFKKKDSFWRNCKAYHKRLVKGLNSKKIFKVFALISRAVPIELFKELAPSYLELASKNKPFGITNLGSLDKFNLFFTSKGFKIKNLYGGVSGTYDALVVAVFTIENKIHFHFHYYKPPHTDDEIDRYIDNSNKQLDNALNS
ncbi:MAG: condensation domain-containing protein [Candidatus Hodarchaeota archaeon]